MAGRPLASPPGACREATLFKTPANAPTGGSFRSGWWYAFLENISRVLRRERLEGHLSRFKGVSFDASSGSLGTVQFRCADHHSRWREAGASLFTKSVRFDPGPEGSTVAGFPETTKAGYRKRIMARETKQFEAISAGSSTFTPARFVHGDLVPTNIFVSRSAEKGIRLFFMDNDRTRRYPKWFPQVFWRRNLVQLNRIPLPGITLQDRVRFLSYYLGSKEWGGPERRLLFWLERKTRQRRSECDSVDANGSFRQLMRWNGELT